MIISIYTFFTGVAILEVGHGLYTLRPQLEALREYGDVDRELRREGATLLEEIDEQRARLTNAQRIEFLNEGRRMLQDIIAKQPEQQLPMPMRLAYAFLVVHLVVQALCILTLLWKGALYLGVVHSGEDATDTLIAAWTIIWFASPELVKPLMRALFDQDDPDPFEAIRLILKGYTPHEARQHVARNSQQGQPE